MNENTNIEQTTTEVNPPPAQNIPITPEQPPAQSPIDWTGIQIQRVDSVVSGGELLREIESELSKE